MKELLTELHRLRKEHHFGEIQRTNELGAVVHRFSTSGRCTEVDIRQLATKHDFSVHEGRGRFTGDFLQLKRTAPGQITHDVEVLVNFKHGSGGNIEDPGIQIWGNPTLHTEARAKTVELVAELLQKLKIGNA